MALVEWVGDEDALELAAALEAHSNHPIAEALVRSSGSVDAHEVEGFEANAGAGVSGFVDGQHVLVGSPDWIASEIGASLDSIHESIRSAVNRFAADGHTPVLVAVDNAVAGVAAVGDRLRDDAAALVRMLEDEGKEVHILSGDHPEAVEVVARRLGMPPERAHGSVGPEEKRAAVEQLQHEGRTVLMVGDGVNDAAALRAADVGVAVGGGSTASLVAADVFMTRPGIAPVAELLNGSSAVMRTIRTTLGISLLYNLVAAAAAMAGLVTPLVAAVAMPVSSLLVVTMAILQPSFRNARRIT